MQETVEKIVVNAGISRFLVRLVNGRFESVGKIVVNAGKDPRNIAWTEGREMNRRSWIASAVAAIAGLFGIKPKTDMEMLEEAFANGMNKSMRQHVDANIFKGDGGFYVECPFAGDVLDELGSTDGYSVSGNNMTFSFKELRRRA